MEEQIMGAAGADPLPCWWGGACDLRCLQDRSRQQLVELEAAAVAQPQAPEPKPSSSAPGS